MHEALIVIPGQPKSKGRPRFARGRVFTPASTLQYERLVAAAAREVISEPITGNVQVDILAVYQVPKSWAKALQASARRGDIMPTRPDIDNVIKICLDGMNEAAYLDDQQVHMISAEKRYGDLARVEIRLNW
jgi:Holliday junction resolvase RusA-like endonuclease